MVKGLSNFNLLYARLGADIYNEPAMIKEYNEGSGDIKHVSLYSNVLKKSGKIGEKIWKFHKFLLYLYITNRYNSYTN